MTSQHSSNQDLYNFLVQLKEWLGKNGKVELAAAISDITDSAYTSSSEFLGDTRNILSRIQAAGIRTLSESKSREIEQAIDQIDMAFRKANGLV